MYHRYQSDGNGQFTRRTVPAPAAPKPSAAAHPTTPPPQPASPPSPHPPPRPSPQPGPEQGLFGLSNALPFLQRLLPNTDSGDLLLMLILLLLLSEGTEDATTAAMTIAIFLFLQ